MINDDQATKAAKLGYMYGPTQKQVEAAQSVFEHWFCEELGLDMDSAESEAIIRKMLRAALSA